MVTPSLSFVSQRSQVFSDDRDDIEIELKTSSIPSSSSFEGGENHHVAPDWPLLERQVYIPLAISMAEQQDIRSLAFERKDKRNCKVKSTDGWLKTIFMIEGRALDNIIVPWTIVTVHAILWTVLHEIFNLNFSKYTNDDHWEGLYSVVVKSSLAFLLVFRLNRVAMRYWETRNIWGQIIIASRCIVSGVLTHVTSLHDLKTRDQIISWVAGFAIATMHHIRNESYIPPEELAGVLTEDEVRRLSSFDHPPLQAALKIRLEIQKAFAVSADTPPSLAHANAVRGNLLEQKVNVLVENLSGLEKIRSTPIPIVYIAHLRTCLIFYLMTLPYVWGDVWGWGTIPVVAITAFALLGIEGAAMECEVPFSVKRVNHLDMDCYCETILGNIQQMLTSTAAAMASGHLLYEEKRDLGVNLGKNVGKDRFQKTMKKTSCKSLKRQRSCPTY